MTIEEAIEIFKEDTSENTILNLSELRSDELAEWLEELRDYRSKNKMVVRIDCLNLEEMKDKVIEAYNQGRADGRAEAIDDVERELLGNGFIATHHALEVWHEISEQLKSHNYEVNKQ